MPGINTPGSTPEVDKVLQAVKEQKDIALDENDLAVVIDNSRELADKAKVTLDTKEQLQGLLDLIEREEKEAENADVVKDGRIKLDALRAEINTTLAAKNAPAVADLEAAPDPTKPKTFVDQIKGSLGVVGVGAMGMAVRAWIFIQRTMIDLGIASGDKTKLDKIEELYGNWFGAAEMREQIGTTLKASGIEIRKGTQDGVAYVTLQEHYKTWLAAKLPERKDKDGKVVPPTDAMINAVKQQASIGVFLSETAKKYGNTHRGPTEPKKKRVTTLMGISNNEKPSVVDA